MMADSLVNPCLSCQHYFITWKKNYPHGCRSFNIETKYYPSFTIIKESKMKCLYYKKKNISKNKNPHQPKRHSPAQKEQPKWEIII